MIHGLLNGQTADELGVGGLAAHATLDFAKPNYYSMLTADYLALVGYADLPCPDPRCATHPGWYVFVFTVGYADLNTNYPSAPEETSLLYTRHHKTLWEALNTFGLVAWHPQGHTALTSLGFITLEL